ncbi:MAG: hypothetical protein ABFD96_22890 [Armatimonadia bacterium]
MKRFALFVALVLLSSVCLGQELVKVLERKDIDFLTEDVTWAAGGGPEASVRMGEEQVKAGKKALEFSAKIDLQGPAGAQYLAGWPNCQYVPAQAWDWSGYDRVAFWIRVDSADKKRLFPIRFIIHTEGKTSLNKMIKPFRAGEWVRAEIDISRVGGLDKVNLVHLFLCEDEYPDKLAMKFTVDGFELLKTQRMDAYLPPQECSAGLYVGEGETWTLLEPGTPKLAGVLKLTTGTESALKPEDTVAWRARGMFGGTEKRGTMKLGQAVAAGAKGEVAIEVPLAGLAPDYYLLTADVQRGGKSLCGGRVGADDFYVKKPGETMAYTALSYRLGTTYWIMDRVYGGMMTNGKLAMPHTYDPLDKATYFLWLRAWCTDAGKNSEGLEAGVTGLVFACEAFRQAGDKVRTAAADKMLKDTLDYMIRGMQDPDGGTKIVTNELVADYGDVLGDMGGAAPSRDSNQVGEWARPIARAICYFRNIKGQEKYVEKLLKASCAAADFIVRNSTDKVGEREHVLRHYKFPPYTAEGARKPLKGALYHQEGRQCEVYTGRAMSGVSYVAYAMALCGKKVPAEWLTMLRETTAWAAERMGPQSGWFDWGCADVVEGGCHTFLGNMYIGEGTMGHYLVERTLGNKKEAQAAAEATKLAYRYVTDGCIIRGQKFGIPTEFWVGPYLYWELLEYNTYVEKDPVFAEWLAGISDAYVKQTEWKAFTDRGKAWVGRSSGNGSLVASILGWLGLYEMEQAGQAWKGYEGMGGK